MDVFGMSLYYPMTIFTRIVVKLSNIRTWLMLFIAHNIDLALLLNPSTVLVEATSSLKVEE